jgi:hypothetical protein
MRMPKPTDRAMDQADALLMAWGAALKGEAGGSGYPTKSVLHPSWSPPAIGVQGGMQVAAGQALPLGKVHRGVLALPLKLQDTLVVVYVMRESVQARAVLLGCQDSTVRARVLEAKRRLIAGGFTSYR